MRTVLVTGGIASGKSEVCSYLASKGYAVYDSDSRTKALYELIPQLKENVEKAIGRPFSEVGVIFSDPVARERLESVVYPEVLEDFRSWRSQASGDMVFFESAVALQKSIFDHLWDEVWLIKAPLETRIRRNAKVPERMGAQQPCDDSRADIMIENDSTIEELHRKIDKILNDMKTDLSKILSISGKHGLYRFLALSRGNAAIGESLSDGHRTVFDSHSRITTLADIAIYTDEGEFKLKDVFLSINKVLDGKEAPSSKAPESEIRALFDKAVPNYDPDRFYFSHMKKILDWYGEIVKYASLDFVEEEEGGENAEA